jgi:PIN domain nuclease of toxin-antitoxin system
VRLLLDAHILMWAIDRPQRLHPDARAALLDPNNAVYASVVSAWEMAIKVSLGKLPIRPNIASWLPEELEIADFALLGVTLEHVLAVEHLPFHHRDPFDRLLVAQAIVEDLTLVTNDRQLERYQVRLMPCW